jgi:hypothetical protein
VAYHGPRRRPVDRGRPARGARHRRAESRPWRRSTSALDADREDGPAAARQRRASSRRERPARSRCGHERPVRQRPGPAGPHGEERGAATTGGAARTRPRRDEASSSRSRPELPSVRDRATAHDASLESARRRRWRPDRHRSDERRSGAGRRSGDERRSATRSPSDQLSLGRRLRQPRTIISLILPIILLVLFAGRCRASISRAAGPDRRREPALLLAAFVVFYLGFPLAAGAGRS